VSLLILREQRRLAFAREAAAITAAAVAYRIAVTITITIIAIAIAIAVTAVAAAAIAATGPHATLTCGTRTVEALRIDRGYDAIVQVRVTIQGLRHFDHGYAVTSHSSLGPTAERVLVNIDTDVHPELINQLFACVSVSRASHDAQLYTGDISKLASVLSYDSSKSSVIQSIKTRTIAANLSTIGALHSNDIGSGFLCDTGRCVLEMGMLSAERNCQT
jgi:hypothetical protein